MFSKSNWMPSRCCWRHSSASDARARVRAVGSVSTRCSDARSKPGFITSGTSFTAFSRAVATRRGSSSPRITPLESITKTCGETIEIWSAWARKAWRLASPRTYQRDSRPWASILAARRHRPTRKPVAFQRAEPGLSCMTNSGRIYFPGGGYVAGEGVALGGGAGRRAGGVQRRLDGLQPEHRRRVDPDEVRIHQHRQFDHQG